MDHDDDYFDKALEGFALFAFNKGEVCTCPSRALIQESIFDKFMEKAVARVAKIKVAIRSIRQPRWAPKPRTISLKNPQLHQDRQGRRRQMRDGRGTGASRQRP